MLALHDFPRENSIPPYVQEAVRRFRGSFTRGRHYQIKWENGSLHWRVYEGDWVPMGTSDEQYPGISGWLNDTGDEYRDLPPFDMSMLDQP